MYNGTIAKNTQCLFLHFFLTLCIVFKESVFVIWDVRRLKTWRTMCYKQSNNCKWTLTQKAHTTTEQGTRVHTVCAHRYEMMSYYPLHNVTKHSYAYNYLTHNKCVHSNHCITLPCCLSASAAATALQPHPEAKALCRWTGRHDCDDWRQVWGHEEGLSVTHHTC